MRELVLAIALAAGPAAAQDALPEPLTAKPGDAARGRAIAASRQQGLCLLCHAAPLPEPHLQGNLGPDLSGVATRLTVPQMRARLVDARRVNPQSLMPAYHRIEGLHRVGGAWRGQPLLDAQQIEDVLAWLATLR